MKIFTILVIATCSLLNLNMLAQCPTCVPDETCISTDGFPAVCPLTPPNATAGVYYEEQLTFYMPTTIIDPGTGIEATLLEVTITSVTGLPYGIEFTLNDADGTFHPSDGENFGCATTCGIPLLPGTYDMVISVSALVEALGFELTQVQSFTSTLVVEPGEGSANSFSFDNIANCGSLEVNYNALISVPAPSVTTYSWDFGNGETSDLASPSTVMYDAPGDYTTVLSTIISDYVLHEVSVSNLNDNWSGDIDDAFSSADPFFVITDGNGNAVYSSATIDNTVSTTWADPNFTIAAPPYSIEFFDEDQFSQNDGLGVTAIPLTEGVNFFDIGNGTVGTITMTLEVSNQFEDSTVVTVFSVPDATMIATNNVLSCPGIDLETFVWYRNDIPIADAFTSSYTMLEGGLYYVAVTNSFGCAATSIPYLYCPAIEVLYDENAQEVSVADGFESYQWFYNGLAVDGATSFYYIAENPGNYAVEITTSYGCTTESNVYTLEVGVEQQATISQTRVYPNPVGDVLFIHAAGGMNSGNIQIYDILGKAVLIETANASGQDINISVTGLSPGVYFADINGERIRLIKK